MVDEALNESQSNPAITANSLAGVSAALQQARRKLQAARQERSEPLAVIGMACRFPGAGSLAEFWDLLLDGRSGVTQVPGDRWDVAKFMPAPSGQQNRSGVITSPRGGFLNAVDRFDAGLFGISRREAVSLDPQHRIFLETAWRALEDAGLESELLRGSRTGVFLGVCSNDYLHRLARRGYEQIDAYLGTGNAHSTAVGRLSYFLGLAGPAVAIDTACSSSLTALHVAAQSIRTGDCDTAIVGGVNLILTPELSINLSAAGMLSPRGECSAFSADADGFVRGEGCGVVVLKRLSAALAEGDRVWCSLRGTAVNQDGHSNGLTAPSGPAQQAVIRRALANCELRPEDIDYLEAHGTGTELGDPTEMAALGAVFGDRSCPLHVGSVKTNVGHLEGAAGIAGFIKAALVVHHGVVPPNRNFTKPSPHIDWRLPLRVPQQQIVLPAEQQRPRRAGVSSFGFGGSNAHAVVEQAPPVSDSVARGAGPSVVVLSGRSAEGLHIQAAEWAQAISNDTPLEALAYASARRTQHAHRLAIAAEDAQSLRNSLEAFSNNERPESLPRGVYASGGATGDLPIGFLFGGQGSVRPDMGRALAERYPVFRDSWNACGETLADLWPRPLNTIAWGEPERWLTGVDSQIVLVAWQIAVAELWRSWIGKPAWVLGHSLGEVAAAVAAERMSRDSALQLVCVRARALDQIPTADRGGMLAVMAPVDAVRPLLAGSLCVAAINGTRQTVVSGSLDDLAALRGRLQSLRSATLATSHAFHSRLVESAVEDLHAVGRRIPSQSSEIGFWSTCTGGALEGAIPASYWGDQLLKPVLFSEAVGAAGVADCIEVSPSPTLAPLCDLKPLPACGPRSDHEVEGARTSAARLWTRGRSVAWRQVQRAPRLSVSLPGAPLQRERYWFTEPGDTSPGGLAEAQLSLQSLHPLLGARLDLSGSHNCFEVDLAKVGWLAGHAVDSRPTLPAVAYLEMALAVGSELDPTQAWEVAELTIEDRVSWDQGAERRLQTHAIRSGDDWRIEFHAKRQGGWRRVATALLTELGARPIARPVEGTSLQLSASQHYTNCRNLGVAYSGVFCGLRELHGGDSAAEAVLEPMDPTAADGCWTSLVDAALQALFGCSRGGAELLGLPVGVGRFAAFDGFAGPLRARAWLRSGEPQGGQHADHQIADVQVIDAADQVVALLYDVLLRSAPTSADRRNPINRSVTNGASHAVNTRHDLLAEVMAVEGAARGGRILALVRGRLAGVLDEPEGSILPDAPLDSLGLDSLMAYELRDDLLAALGVEVPMELFLQEATLRELADWIGAKLSQQPPRMDGPIDTVPPEHAWIEGSL